MNQRPNNSVLVPCDKLAEMQAELHDLRTTHQGAANPDLPNKLQIVVQIKSNYGNQAIYPVCAKAMTFAVMLGQRTLTPNDIEHIRSLGYTIAVDPQQPREL